MRQAVHKLSAVTALYQAASLLGAGIIAGLVGTAGGVTSLVSAPALLAVGIPALLANITNLVAVLACWPGSALASGPELTGKGPWLRRWLPIAAVGGALARRCCWPPRHGPSGGSCRSWSSPAHWRCSASRTCRHAARGLTNPAPGWACR